MCFLLLSQPKLLPISWKSFLDKDRVQLSDSEAKWQCRNQLSCTQSPSSTWKVTHGHTRGRKKPKCIVGHNKVRRVEGWRNLAEIWKAALKTQFGESLSSFVLLGLKMLSTFPRCSAGSRIVPESGSGNASASTESCGNDFHCMERGHSPARVFQQSKQQPGGWAIWTTACSSFTTMQSCHGSLFPFLLLDMFWRSCSRWLWMVIQVGSSHSPAVISLQLVLTSHCLWFDWGCFICLFDWFLWVGFFVFFSLLLGVSFPFLEMTGEVGTTKLQKT